MVKGNCDAEVDEMISEFKFYKIIKMNICGKRMAFTHGHIYNIDKPLDDIDILIHEEDLEKAIDFYNSRERKFGGLK